MNCMTSTAWKLNDKPIRYNKDIPASSKECIAIKQRQYVCAWTLLWKVEIKCCNIADFRGMKIIFISRLSFSGHWP